MRRYHMRGDDFVCALVFTFRMSVRGSGETVCRDSPKDLSKLRCLLVQGGDAGLLLLLDEMRDAYVRLALGPIPVQTSWRTCCKVQCGRVGGARGTVKSRDRVFLLLSRAAAVYSRPTRLPVSLVELPQGFFGVRPRRVAYLPRAGQLCCQALSRGLAAWPG